MAQDMYRELRVIKHTFNPEDSLDRRYVEKLADKLLHGFDRSADRVQGAARKGATPIATQHRSIYFDPNSSSMSLDSRAIVDELAGTMRAYENTVVDIDGNTDSTGSRAYNIQLSHARADEVKNYLMQKYGFPVGSAAHGRQRSGQADREQHDAGRAREKPAHRYQGVCQPFKLSSRHGSSYERSVHHSATNVSPQVRSADLTLCRAWGIIRAVVWFWLALLGEAHFSLCRSPLESSRPLASCGQSTTCSATYL